MKRIVSLITVLAIFTLLLTGCGKIDVGESAEKLKAKGFTESFTCETDEELDDMTELYNTQIEHWGGDFTVEIKAYTFMMQDWSPLYNVEFITFSRKKEAKAYAELYAASRDDYSDYKVAQKGRTVVITNVDSVAGILDLEFE